RMVGYLFRPGQQAEALEFRQNDETTVVRLPCALNVSGADAYIAAGRSGFGLIQAARHALQRELAAGELVEVMAETAPPPMPVWLMHPPGRFIAPRVRVMLDWLAALLQQ
ncbi:LysR substrate-binding domain-containing protein, partial [Chimaeribacter arupi]